MMTHLPFRGLERAAWERLATVAAATAWWLSLGAAVFGAWQLGGVDFRGYYAASHVWLQGGDPYDYAQVGAVLQAVTGRVGNNPFYYPPWFLFVVAPFGGLPFQMARFVWAVLNGVLFWLGCRLAVGALGWRVTGWQRRVAYLSALYLFGWMTLRFEQAAIFVFVCLVAALVFWQRRRPWRAGLCLVLAATKPQPAWFAIGALLLYGFVTFRPVVRAAVGTLVAVLVAATVSVPGWWRALTSPTYARGLAYKLDGPDAIVARRINTTFFDWAAWLGASEAVATAGYVVLFALVTGVLLYAVRQGAGLHHVTAVGLVGSALLAPYALQYDYAPLVFVLFFVYRQYRRKSAGWIALVPIVGAMSVPLWERPMSDGYWIALFLGLALAVGGIREIS